MKKPTTKERPVIYITELCEIVDREANTIRKWERHKKLPKHLLPKRGKKDMRYWTHEQVFGKKGIVQWMIDNDMRPGNYLAQPENEGRHVKALRRPKLLSNDLILLAQKMARAKKSVEEIVEEIYPHTQYVSPERLEIALRDHFRKQGWYFPRRQAKRQRKQQAPRNLLRDLEIVRKHEKKVDHATIAEEYDISVQRVKQIIRQFYQQ